MSSNNADENSYFCKWKKQSLENIPVYIFVDVKGKNTRDFIDNDYLFSQVI